jgi:hypothetical protein
VDFLHARTKPESRRHFPIDVLMKDYVESLGDDATQYIVIPCLVDHTGMKTSSETKAKQRMFLSDAHYYANSMKFASVFEDLSGEVLDEMTESLTARLSQIDK